MQRAMIFRPRSLMKRWLGWSVRQTAHVTVGPSPISTAIAMRAAIPFALRIFVYRVVRHGTQVVNVRKSPRYVRV